MFRHTSRDGRERRLMLCQIVRRGLAYDEEDHAELHGTAFR